MKQSDNIKHVTEKLFDVLMDVDVEVVLAALAVVMKEFVRAKNEPETQSRFRESKVD
jgi:hypothetical protein